MICFANLCDNPAQNFYFGAKTAPRSGLAWKKHIDVGAGVIDADYRGNVGVVLFNHAKEDFVGRWSVTLDNAQFMHLS